MYPVLIALSLFAADPPPEREQALRATVAKFADAFVEGKLRKAYALVDEESQESFLEMGKLRFTKYEWKDAAWSKDFTAAKVTLTVDTEFHMAGTTVPVQRPWESYWKWKDGEWLWTYQTSSTVQTPFGDVTVDPNVKPEKINLEEKIKQGVKPEDLAKPIAMTKEIVFSRTKPSEADLVITNPLQGHVTFAPQIPRIAGMKIDRLTKPAGPGETIKFRLYWNPPAGANPPELINCIMDATPVGGGHVFTLIFRD